MRKVAADAMIAKLNVLLARLESGPISESRVELGFQPFLIEQAEQNRLILRKDGFFTLTISGKEELEKGGSR